MPAGEKETAATGADDAHLPRLQRRFPYRALNAAEAAEVRVDIDVILRGITDMIHAAILKRMTPRELRQTELRHELFQDVAVHLWEYSLPRFDASRGTKVTTFAFTCIRWRVSERLKAHRRQRRLSRQLCLEAEMIAAPDSLYDRAVEAAADQIIKDPAAFGLGPAEVRCVRAVLDSEPSAPRQMLAEQVGYKSATSFCSTIQKACRRISDIELI